MNGEMYGPYHYRGENAVNLFLTYLQEVERWIRGPLRKKKPLEMTPEDWAAYKKATDCHICRDPLVKHNALDAMDT